MNTLPMVMRVLSMQGRPPHYTLFEGGIMKGPLAGRFNLPMLVLCPISPTRAGPEGVAPADNDPVALW